jgi:hypothetical protein
VPPTDRLLGVNLKMTRAKKQVDWVFDEVGRFLDGDPYAVEKYFDTKAGEYVCRGRILKEPRPEWSIAISECLHLYNSVLDNMAWIVASPDGEVPPKGTGFPIRSSKAAYRKLWSHDGGYYMVRAMPVRAQAIIEDAQPYHRGKASAGHPLWVLRRLANMDKHEAVHLAASSIPEIKTEVLEAEGVKLPSIKQFKGPFKDGAEIFRMGVPKLLSPGKTSGAKMKMNFNFAFGVALPKDGPGNGRDVRIVLEEIQHAVESVCRELLPYVEPLVAEPPLAPAPTEIRLAD